MTAALIKEARKLTWPHDTPHDAERAQVIEELCDALEAAERERDAAKAEAERLRSALVDARGSMAPNHMAHWDREGTRGLNCPACNRQREAYERINVALKGTADGRDE